MRHPQVRWLFCDRLASGPFAHEGLLLSPSLLAELPAKALWPMWWVRLMGFEEALCARWVAWVKDELGILAVVAKTAAQEPVILMEGSAFRLALLSQAQPDGELGDLHRHFVAWWKEVRQMPAPWSLQRPSASPGEVAWEPWTWQAHQPLIMGIVNATPDSFSDGGQFLETKRAVAHARQLIAEGADMIDIGGESTRPGAAAVSAEDEARRVVPVIEALVQGSDGHPPVEVPISIDTYKASVAQAACDAGATIINDISCMRFEPALAQVAAQQGAHVIIMHSRHRPTDMQEKPGYEQLWDELLEELWRGVEVVLEAGVPLSHVAVDPGIGFGKRIQDNYRLLRELQVLTGWGLPVLVGASRKSFIGAISGASASERLGGSLAAAAVSAWRGANILRVHDVKETKQMIDVLSRVEQPPRPVS